MEIEIDIETKINKSNKTTSKKIVNNAILENYDIIAIFSS